MCRNQIMVYLFFIKDCPNKCRKHLILNPFHYVSVHQNKSEADGCQGDMTNMARHIIGLMNREQKKERRKVKREQEGCREQSLGQDVFGGGYRIAQSASCPGVIALSRSFLYSLALSLSLSQDQRLIQEGHLMRVNATAFRE